MPPPAQITVLRTASNGLLATKRISRTVKGRVEVAGYDNVRKWFADIYSVEDIHDLSELLGILEKRPNACIIRALPCEGIDRNKPVLRRVHTGKDGIKWFDDIDQPWVMLDFDKIKLKAPFDLYSDPLEAVQLLIATLPACFQDVSFHWQLSSSAGLDPASVKLSAHVWFYLDRKISNADLKYWFEQNAPNVDRSLFRAVQPHYTAAPIFDQMTDPLPQRSGFYEGEDDYVTMPEIDIPIMPRYETGAAGELSGVVGFEEKLKYLGDPPANPNGKGFHEVLISAVSAFVGTHGRKRTEEQREALKATLRQHIEDAPKRDGREDISHYLTDYYLDQNIDSAIEKFGDAADLKASAPPHFQSSPVPVEEAVSRLETLTGEFFEQALDYRKDIDLIPPQIALRLPAGIGKTEKVIEGLVDALSRPDARQKHINVYLPNHMLAAEWYGRLKAALTKAGIQCPVTHIRGRASGAPDSPMCAKYEIAARVANLGLPVQATLCSRKVEGKEQKCDQFDRCPYQKQFEDKSPGVRVLPHEYLFTPLPPGAPEPDIAIIDERFFSTGLVEESFPLEHLTATRNPFLFGTKGVDAEALADLNRLTAYVSSSLKGGLPLLKALRNGGFDEDYLKDAARTEFGGADAPPLGPQQSLSEQETLLEKCDRSTALLLYRTWMTLRDELEMARDQSLCVQLKRNFPAPGSGEKQDRVFIHTRRVIRTLGIPNLIIDADADHEINRRFLHHLKTHEIQVERKARVTQICDTVVSKRKLSTGETLALLKDAVRLRAGQGKSIFVVCNKPFVGAFENIPGVMVGHFGAVRGMNHWQDCEEVYVIGREQPAPDGIEGMARALFWRDDVPLKVLPDNAANKTLNQELRGYRLRNKSTQGALAAVHPDKRVQRVLEQVRECESTQAIDRLRLIHGPKVKQVFIVSNLPLDITVDALTTWNDFVPSRIERAILKGGALPLFSGEASRCYPEFWATPKAAKHDFQRTREKGPKPLMEKGSQTLNGSTKTHPNQAEKKGPKPLMEKGPKPLIIKLLRGCTPFLHVTYRTPKQRGNPVPAIVDTRRGNPRKALEAVVGEITSFEIISHTETTTAENLNTPHEEAADTQQGIPETRANHG